MNVPVSVARPIRQRQIVRYDDTRQHDMKSVVGETGCLSHHACVPERYARTMSDMSEACFISEPTSGATADKEIVQQDNHRGDQQQMDQATRHMEKQP